MAARLATLVLVVFVAAIGQLQQFSAADSSLGATLTATLTRRVHSSDAHCSQTEKLQRAARRSLLRVESLLSRRELAAAPDGSADWETILSDASQAEYLMGISLGTPPQDFVAIADTGSDLTWIACAPCTGCSSVSNTFEPTQSSTYVPLSCASSTCAFLNISATSCLFDPSAPANPETGCDYIYSYGDGTETVGTIAKDTITLQKVKGGNQTVPGYQFGCSSNANASILDSTDGLVGLGRGNISFPSQLGSYFGNKFGYCLVDRLDSDSVIGSPLYFGGDAVPAAANGSALQFTPIIDTNASTTYFYVGVDSITVNGKDAGVPASAWDIDVDGSGGLFFDSGTTFTTLSDVAFNPLANTIASTLTGYGNPDTSDQNGFPLCYSARWSDWMNDDNIPTISFQFSNTTGYDLTVDTAWVDLGNGQVCLAIQSDSDNTSIFGNYQQVDYHVLYDLDAQHIGFVPANCTYTVVSKNPSDYRPYSGVSQRPVANLFASLALALMVLFVFTQ